jgi:SAM-dependent methyltransferase
VNSCIVVQCSSSDLLDSGFYTRGHGAYDPADPDGYSVGPLLAAGLGPIVLAAPDLPENRETIPALAEQWGVHAHLGDVHDVLRRLRDAATEQGADMLARVVLAAFYVDPQVVTAQLELLAASGADYCTLPPDYRISFGADVITVDALARFAETLDGDAADLARYRPWPFLEADERVATVYADDFPPVPAERIAWIRSHPNWPERSGPGGQGGEHRALVARYVRDGDVVLDAGCGHGEITNIISRKATEAVGVDFDPAIVEIARGRFPHCEFHVVDLQQWSAPGRFDTIIHCHTLEHCPDELAVLRNLKASLREGGRLVVEVPLELRPGIVNPHHDREYSRERLDWAIGEAGLSVTERLGVTRGVYRPHGEAREAIVAVCEAA